MNTQTITKDSVVEWIDESIAKKRWIWILVSCVIGGIGVWQGHENARILTQVSLTQDNLKATDGTVASNTLAIAELKGEVRALTSLVTADFAARKLMAEKQKRPSKPTENTGGR